MSYGLGFTVVSTAACPAGVDTVEETSDLAIAVPTAPLAAPARASLPICFASRAFCPLAALCTTPPTTFADAPTATLRTSDAPRVAPANAPETAPPAAAAA